MSRGPFFLDVARQQVFAGDWVFWVPSGSGLLQLRQIISVQYGEANQLTVKACPIEDVDRPATHRQISPYAVGLYRSRPGA